MRNPSFTKLVILFIILASNIRLSFPAQAEEYTLLETLQIGKGNANSIKWNPNIELLAVGGSDGIRIYNGDLQEVSHFEDQVRNVDYLAWSPDGTKIASHGSDVVVQIRDTETGNILSTLTQPNGVYALAWSPDGQYLAVSSGISTRHQIIIWNWRLGEVTITIENQERLVSMDWSPDGTRIVAGSWDSNVYIWNINTSELLAQIRNNHSIAFAVAWSPDGQMFATTGSSETALTVWDANIYEPIFNSQVSENVDAIAWKPDSSQIAINSSDGKVFILSATTGERLNTIDAQTEIITSLTWNHNGNKLAILTGDYLIKIWDITYNSFSATLDSFSTGLAVAVAWRPNSEQIAIVFNNIPVIKIFDGLNGSLLNELDIPLNSQFVGFSSSIAWNPGGDRLLYTGNDGDTIYIWNLLDGQSLEPIVIIENHGLYVPTWSPDGNRIASLKVTEASNEILVWSAATGEQLDRLSIQESGLFFWNHDGAFIVFQNQQGYWQLGDTSHQIVMTTSLSGTHAVMAIGDPNNDQIIVADCEGQLEGCQLWEGDFASGEFTQLINDESIDFITDLAWSPDSNLLALSGEFTIHIWDMRTLSLIAETEFSNSDIPISWSFDSRRIAVVTGGTVKILSLEG